MVRSNGYRQGGPEKQGRREKHGGRKAKLMAVGKTEREARLKAALRDNLRKRKEQERAQDVPTPAEPDEGSAPAER
ncbi:MAG: hypothetical protein DI568_00335 [Sphingomonas sp.]|nr:MAG: hypothetical protein DI568_00335 [Sphingomonas sp.]